MVRGVVVMTSVYAKYQLLRKNGLTKKQAFNVAHDALHFHYNTKSLELNPALYEKLLLNYLKSHNSVETAYYISPRILQNVVQIFNVNDQYTFDLWPELDEEVANHLKKLIHTDLSTTQPPSLTCEDLAFCLLKEKLTQYGLCDAILHDLSNVICDRMRYAVYETHFGLLRDDSFYRLLVDTKTFNQILANHPLPNELTSDDISEINLKINLIQWPQEL